MRTNEIICDFLTSSTVGGKFCKHSYRQDENPWPPLCNNYNNRSCPYAYFCNDSRGDGPKEYPFRVL